MNVSFFTASALILLISSSFVLISTPWIIKRLIRKKLLSPDMNKKKRPMVAKVGGISLAFGFILALLISLQLKSAALNFPLMLAAICSTVIIAFVGLIDDILDVPDRYRVLLPLFAALPLTVTKAGTSTMNFIFFTVDFNLGVYVLPFVGPVTLNLYPLVLIPVGVVACSNLFNLLGGFNGLEAGSGAVVSLVLFTASMLLYLSGSPGAVESAFLMIALFGACMAFLAFNWYPAKVFPGNITTYLIGAAVVSAVVIGNMERVGIIAVMPQIIEFLLKSRSGFKAENFGYVGMNGKLNYSGKIYSLTHLLMKHARLKEAELVGVLLLIQAIFGIIALSTLFL